MNSETKLAEHLFLKISGPVDDERRIYNTLLDACHRADVRVCSTTKHELYPSGFSAIVLLSESHASVHTWPEFDTALVDFVTCSKSPDFDSFISAFEKAGYRIVSKEVLNR